MFIKVEGFIYQNKKMLRQNCRKLFGLMVVIKDIDWEFNYAKDLERKFCLNELFF